MATMMVNPTIVTVSKKRKINEIEEFIEYVRPHQCLYDKKSVAYKDTVYKQSVWTAIGARFQITAEAAEKKWKVQRDRYMREKKLIKCSSVSGSGSTDIYRFRWELFPLMDSILGGYIGCTETTLNNETRIVENDNYVDNVDTESTQLSSENLSENQMTQNDLEIAQNIDINQETESDQRYQSSDSNKSFNQQEKRRKKSDTCSNQDYYNNALLSLSSTSTAINSFLDRSCNVSEPDKIELFCESLKLRLRKLDARDQFNATKNIKLLMLDLEGQEKYFM
ncbi:uncharacterized protein [Centruroides vittatus]|uniref:uncharacterized protein n=1 Tax=Centruroides vittatus TaxID=120091 RepID=UPI00350E93DB